MNRVTIAPVAVLLLALPSAGRAQEHGWWTTGAIGQTWFSPAAHRDGTSFGPGPGLGADVGVRRSAGSLEFGLAVEVQPSALRASDSASAVQLSAVPFSRTGVVLSLAHPVHRTGGATLLLDLAVRGDIWTLSSASRRTRLGAGAGIALRFGTGPLRFENRLTSGISQSVFSGDDLAEGYRRTAMAWVRMEMGVLIRM